MKAELANRLWLASSRRSSIRFHDAAKDVAGTQLQLLRYYLARNRDTQYVSEHYPDLPLSTYDDYLPYIERIANGEKNILTVDPVLMFELSSGSTSASKLIPYTRTLKNEFQRGLSSWIRDLYSHHPGLISGPAYWSISPILDGPGHTPAGIPIGFEEDSEYLGPLGFLIGSALAVPNMVKHIHDMTAFRYVTLLFLLRCSALRLISVWNPTFLTLLLEPLSEWWDPLLRDLSLGSVTPPKPIEGSLLHQLSKKLKPDPNRAKRLSSSKPNDYSSIWPHLELISCWADGISKSYSDELQANFPNVTIQPKGLLATEAFVSFPLVNSDGTALAVTSHYFEFQTETGDIFPAHHLYKGKTYSVIVTTGGGLYRYQLNDMIEVTGFYGQVPCFKFVGKTDQVSDYFGEKLNEHFVTNILHQSFEKHQLSPAFYMLAPEDAGGFHYTLYIEAPALPANLASELDSALRANFHYDYCRRLGQIGEIQIDLVKHGSEAYMRACLMRGQKLGNIKTSILQKSLGWKNHFSDNEVKRQFP